MYEDDSDGSDDDWFFNSIKRYDDLLMYDLHGVLSCITFNDSDRFLVAVTRENVNEIWELSIPEKLVLGKNSLPSKNRDFSMITAGYTTEKILQMVAVPIGFVASHSKDVIIYSIPSSHDFSDVIKQKLKIRSCDEPASLVTIKDKIYSCCRLSDVEAYDLSTELSISLQPPNISKTEVSRVDTIGCMRSSQLGLSLGLKGSCTVVTLDRRDGSTASVIYEPSIHQNNNGLTSTESFTFDITPDGIYIALASSKGNIKVYDTRNSKKAILSKNIYVGESPVFHNIKFGSSSLLSVSGYDRLVHIFDIKSSLSELTNVFRHDGHRNTGIKTIVTHEWHPSSDNLIFSADNTGELQSWTFKS
ncbi:unnamed protein product [Meganyctiphanes norvegica]|uniref:Uncharacterized protein n=1 Tax=Meganyctiphanes norvegica TaxID=48144 RepID=A0AAV2QXI8_MEGNR